MENPERLPRRLAAIFYADVVGYSRLTGEDEDATHRRLSEYLDLIDNHVTRHGGRVMHYAGDAVLAMFDAVVDALLCAANVQSALESQNRSLAAGQKILFRIGINLGDVIEDRGDIYGDGVNVAARLESLAEPGGICISESVYTAVGKKLPLTYEDLGAQKVKNIAEPVRTYRALTAPDVVLPMPVTRSRRRASNRLLSIAIAALLVVGVGVFGSYIYRQSAFESAMAEFATEAAHPLPDKPSIAVLAFDNLGDDPEQDYFADGLSENIITRLARITGMFVIARNSSFKYKGKRFDVRQVGKDLGVRYVLEGSVQRANDRVRVNAQLIDAITGDHLWANKYDRELDDVFAVLDEITLEVVTQLEVELTMGDHARLIAGGTTSVTALESQLLARKVFFKFERESNLRSRQLSTKATELDPSFAWAYAQRGWTHVMDAIYGWSDDRARTLQQAESLARQALSVDPETQFAYTLLSRVHALRGELDQALLAGRKAVKLTPNDSYPLSLLSHSLVWAGEPEEAVVFIKKALRLEPYPATFQLNFAGEAFFFSGRYQEAIQWFRKSLDRQTRGAQAKLIWPYLIASHVKLEQMPKARAEVDRLLAVHADMTLNAIEQMIRRQPFEDRSFLDEHIVLLRQAGLPDGDPQ